MIINKSYILSTIILILFITFYMSLDKFSNTNFIQIIGVEPTPTPTPITYEEARTKHLVNVGYAMFGLTDPKFDCKDFLKSLDSLDFLSVAFLYNTFGNDFDCVKTLMNDDRLKNLEIHLINEPGHRNYRLESSEFLYFLNKAGPPAYSRLLEKKDRNLKQRFVRYVKPLQKLLKNNLKESTTCYISPGLESNVSTNAGRVLIHWTRTLFPQCKMVWNPVNSGAQMMKKSATRTDFIEGHGPSPSPNKPCITDLDGTDISFPDRKAPASLNYVEGQPKNWINSGNPLRQYIEQYANQCELTFLWTGESNCFDFGYGGNFIPPRQRNCNINKIFPLVSREIEWAHTKGIVIPKKFVFSDREKEAFKDCDEIRSSHDGDSRGFLLKQSEFSDRGGVILTPSDLNNSASIQVYHSNRLIDSYTNTGSFVNRDLWRSNVSPVTYPLKVAIKIKNKNRTICYRVDAPQVRND